MSDSVSYAPGGPSERELRLLGDVKGKRVLELGCGTGANAVALAQQGAVVIGIDTSDDRLAAARERDEAAEVRVDWHHGDLADLAFLRADSIDVVVSIAALSEVDDIARVFRQVERVLKPNAPFVCSYDHPMALCIGRGDVLVRSPFDRGPVEVPRAGSVPERSAGSVPERGAGSVPERNIEGAPSLVYVRMLSDVFTDLHRAGLRVDTLLEPRPAGTRVPSTVIWRARKDGA